MRLSRYLALSGVASRRHSEKIIAAGRVKVSGAVVILPQHRVKPGEIVTVDGRAVQPVRKNSYILLDKPPGFLSTVKDTHGRPTVLQLLGPTEARLYPVGRLDLESTGLLLLTDDGELAYRLTHPRFGVEKRYRVWVKGIPPAAKLRQMSRGIELEEGTTAPAKVKLLRRSRNRALLEITLTEGRKRQVRRMCAACGHPVETLRRTGFAFLTPAGLESGSFRHLAAAEVRRLYRLVGLERQRSPGPPQ